jgi:hypothetical protein
MNEKTIRQKELRIEYLKIEITQLRDKIRDPNVPGDMTLDYVRLCKDKLNEIKQLESELHADETLNTTSKARLFD